MGLLRIYLALCVLDAHAQITTPLLGDAFPALVSGRQAVNIFYVISGFYMALILNSKYQGTKGTILFYQNRILRLWPPYLAVLSVILLASWAIGDSSLFRFGKTEVGFFESLGTLDILSATLIVISNIAILGQDLFWLFSYTDGAWHYAPYGVSAYQNNGATFALNGPAFTVSIELIFYLFAPLTLRRSTRTLLTITVLGLAWHLFFMVKYRYWLDVSYHLFPSSIYFFFLGALAYRGWMLLEQRDLLGSRWALLIFLAAAAAFLISKHILSGGAETLTMAALFALVLPLIFHATKRNKIDRQLGEFSYGIYVIHFPVLLFIENRIDTDHVGFWTAVVTISLAIIMYFALERKIERYRQKRVSGPKTVQDPG